MAEAPWRDELFAVPGTRVAESQQRWNSRAPAQPGPVLTGEAN